MGKKKDKGLKVPKKLMGFKLSKGTRKDLNKLLKMVTHPDTRSIAMSAMAALSSLLAERMAAHHESDNEGESRPTLAH
jgi:hypothetical protein